MTRVNKVLIANRGEIAVRIIRAARDAGIGSVAVYADQDRDALHVTLADEAYALDGQTSADTYLVIAKLLSIARRSGADAVHPGYGFLAENADFAQQVIDAGLTWIGPSPSAIQQLGDKTTARHVAERVGAPLAPGTLNPVSGADEVLDFVDVHGLPVAIKAAFGGGGRGLKVARTREEVPELFESATREAVAAFGRGECFVEKYLDRPRHVETQCLADSAGTVVVISTRDCSLQRRHQKLVEEAPAPFLTDEQNAQLYAASKAILREVGYVGAGTCEFLVAQDGTISFLEVNTRLQVEHPVSEEVTGIDLVREQFRIAAGGLIDYDDPAPRGHSFEFRINGEDPGRGFFPRPAPCTCSRRPAAPASASTPACGPATWSRARSTRCSRNSSSRDPAARTPSSARAAPSTSSRCRGCPPCSPSTARSCATRPSPRRTARPSPSTRAGSRPSSTTPSSRGPAPSRTPPRRPPGTRSWSRSAASASR
ncbi:2-oxoglutarate carboxylase small subunit [Clavibacter michiganensis subsp. michiganensis]|uniref:biotin carboxylase n=1 Tax=Clavibacter michiganensis subsp. michiganensis TaxID=33013 RepID=A0A251XD89_CLAMM|nr:2-oxoglutarate carboxylase small subunit [Clavibacter michiganensis subsp. michiganensis]OUE00021.1 2-oxoglutarate carboxylase small subunit [Clavibacter michiganensis subsp. michiganensis]